MPSYYPTWPTKPDVPPKKGWAGIDATETIIWTERGG